jgi:hypothetical protein
MADVWRTNLPTVEKMVLLVIADHANDEGTQSYPAQTTIAAKASISVRTVQRAVNSLVEGGYIRMFKHSGGSANCREDRRPHLYQINIGKLRGDILTGRTDVADGATMATVTGRQSRPKNHPLEPSLKHPDFDVFWSIYPRKVAKQAALKAWVKAVTVATPELIIAGAQRYADDPNRHPSYTAFPATWLNAHRWGDEPLPPRELSKQEEAQRMREESLKRREQETAEAEAFFKELEERKRQAVPMPEAFKDLFRKI